MKTYKKRNEPDKAIKCSVSVYERLIDFVEKEHGQKYGFLKQEIDKAITEYLDKHEIKGDAE